MLAVVSRVVWQAASEAASTLKAAARIMSARQTLPAGYADVIAVLSSVPAINRE